MRCGVCDIEVTVIDEADGLCLRCSDQMTSEINAEIIKIEMEGKEAHPELFEDSDEDF